MNTLRCDICDALYAANDNTDKIVVKICFDCLRKDKIRTPVEIFNKFLSTKNCKLTEYEQFELHYSSLLTQTNSARAMYLRMFLEKKFGIHNM